MKSKYRIDDPDYEKYFEHVYPPDLEAADRFLERKPPPPPMFTREKVAKTHARSGERYFGLLYEQRAPCHPGEEIYLLYATEQISKEEHDRLLDEYAAQPLSEKFLDILEHEIDERADHYSQLRKITAAMHFDQRDEYPAHIWEPIAAYYAREILRPYTCFVRDQRANVLQTIIDMRKEAGLGPCQAGDYSDCCAFFLVLRVTEFAAMHWFGCMEIGNRSQDSYYYNQPTSAASLFFNNIEGVRPQPQNLLTLVYEEFTAIRLLLRKQAQPAPPLQVRIIEPVTVKPPEPEEQVAGSPTTANDLTGTGLPGEKLVDLTKWAVGQESLSRWWLFRKHKGVWRQQARVEIPSGDAESIMTLLANHGGAISLDEAIKALRGVHHGLAPEKVPRVVTDALAKAKSVIRNQIATAVKCSPNQVDNPIPNMPPGWRAKIEIGFAILDEQQRLVFRLQEELRS